MDAILTTIFQESNNNMASLTINIELENFVITSSEEDATNIIAYGQTTEPNVRCREKDYLAHSAKERFTFFNKLRTTILWKGLIDRI